MGTESSLPRAGHYAFEQVTADYYGGSIHLRVIARVHCHTYN